VTATWATKNCDRGSAGSFVLGHIYQLASGRSGMARFEQRSRPALGGFSKIKPLVFLGLPPPRIHGHAS
jgi:hypothetical protein